MRQILFLALITFTTAFYGVAQADYVDVGDGIQLYYEVHGTGGPPIVLIPGSLQTASIYKDIIPVLAQTRQVIAIEQQGHGHTNDSNRPLTFENFASDISKVLTHLQIPKADIMGYSLGGSVALKFAIQHPDQAGKIIVISSTYKSTGWSQDVHDAMKALTPADFYGSPIHTDYLKTSPHPDQFDNFVTKVITFDLLPFDFGDQNIQNMQSPLLLIMGDNDGVVLEETVNLYKLAGGGIFGDVKGLPKSELAILPNNTHVSVILETEKITTIADKFLSKQ